MSDNNLPTDRQPGTGEVNVEACLELLRDIVANADNNDYLRRELIDQFKPESRLTPFTCRVPAELVESAMKALGLPYPKAPKPRKIPDTPTDAQAAALEPMVTHGALLVTWYGRGRSGAHIQMPNNRASMTVRTPTVDALRDYKWVEKDSDNPWGDSFYVVTEAGREAFARYQSKQPAPA